MKWLSKVEYHGPPEWKDPWVSEPMNNKNKTTLKSNLKDDLFWHLKIDNKREIV